MRVCLWAALLAALALPMLLTMACDRGGSTSAAAESSGDRKAKSGETALAATTKAVVPRQLRLEIVAKHPHQRDAYTQGLVWHEGQLLESCGNYGKSDLRRVDPASGEVLARRKLPLHLFAEGLERIGRRLYQLTWKAGVLLIHDLETLEEVDRLSYQGEGWGLAYDGELLIMSDGSDSLHFREVEGFGLIRHLPVTREGQPQDQLNELEYVDGRLYANLWYRDEILEIDPLSGAVTAVIDASGLLTTAERAGAEVLNGIAWDPESETFWITGKYWPWVFQVRFVE